MLKQALVVTFLLCAARLFAGVAENSLATLSVQIDQKTHESFWVLTAKKDLLYFPGLDFAYGIDPKTRQEWAKDTFWSYVSDMCLSRYGKPQKLSAHQTIRVSMGSCDDLVVRNDSRSNPCLGIGQWVDVVPAGQSVQAARLEGQCADGRILEEKTLFSITPERLEGRAKISPALRKDMQEKVNPLYFKLIPQDSSGWMLYIHSSGKTPVTLQEGEYTFHYKFVTTSGSRATSWNQYFLESAEMTFSAPMVIGPEGVRILHINREVFQRKATQDGYGTITGVKLEALSIPVDDRFGPRKVSISGVSEDAPMR